MSTLVLHDVPDELTAALQASAERNHRSKEKEALHLLAASVGAAPVDWNEFFDRPRRQFPKDYADEIRKAGR
ncbi:MAG: TraY domain-containing protein [Verrucomicrobia bacterium]|nr:TraY domain-containing protein [Verrucomicrobiota bacterium]